MISVVVCTRNRASRLERCLRSMTRMIQNTEWQLVVVDDGSRDHTKPLVERFAASLPLTYVSGGGRGLSQARNAGIAASYYPVIAFTDDDCLVAQDWLAAIMDAFRSNPGLSILGGRVEAAGAEDFPVANRVHSEAENISTIEQIMAWMIGCNMAFRRDVFDAVGLFDAALGKGTPIGSAEDIDLLYRALKRGLNMAYLPGVLVHHAHGRNAAAAVENVNREYVRGRGAFYWKFIGDRRIQKMAYWEVRALLKNSMQHAEQWPSSAVLRSLAAGALYKCFGGIVNRTARAGHRFLGGSS